MQLPTVNASRVPSRGSWFAVNSLTTQHTHSRFSKCQHTSGLMHYKTHRDKHFYFTTLNNIIQPEASFRVPASWPLHFHSSSWDLGSQSLAALCINKQVNKWGSYGNYLSSHKQETNHEDWIDLYRMASWSWAHPQASVAKSPIFLAALHLLYKHLLLIERLKPKQTLASKNWKAPLKQNSK